MAVSIRRVDFFQQPTVSSNQKSPKRYKTTIQGGISHGRRGSRGHTGRRAVTVETSGPPLGVHWSGPYKSAGAVIGVVLLGAIGSGIWDLALSPGIDWAVNRLLRVASWTYDGFADFLYRRVSRDPHNAFARLPYAVVMSGVMCLATVTPVLLIRRLSRLRTSIVLTDTPGESTPGEIVANIDRLRKTVVRVMLPVAGISSVFYLGMMFQDIPGPRRAAHAPSSRCE